MGETLTADELHELNRLAAALQAAESIGLPALICLLTVALNEGLSVSQLAEQTRTPQQSVSRYVAVLLGRYQMDAGSNFEPLIEQRISQSDPRKRSLYLTEAGAELIKQLVRPAQFVAGGAINVSG